MPADSGVAVWSPQPRTLYYYSSVPVLGAEPCLFPPPVACGSAQAEVVGAMKYNERSLYMRPGSRELVLLLRGPPRAIHVLAVCGAHSERHRPTAAHAIAAARARLILT